jgi:O-antigen/teichoic acid export membrane protein
VRLLENTVWQTVDQVVGRGLLFAFYVAIPLIVGLDEYGRFAFLQSFVLLVVQPALFLGLETLVVTGVAGGERAVFAAAVWLRLLALGATAVVVAGVAAWSEPDSRLVLWLLWFYQGAHALLSLVFAYFRGVESMRMEAVIGVGQKALALPLLFVLPLMGVKGALVPAWTLAMVGVGGGLLLLGPYRRAVMPVLRGMRWPGRDDPGLRRLLRDGSQLGLAGFVGVAYFRLGSILLGVLGSHEAVGVYAAAFRIMEATHLVPIVATNVGLPRLVRAGDARAFALRWALRLAALGLAVSGVLFVAAERLIAMLYGASFAAAGTVLAILALAVPPIYAGYVLTQALVAIRRTDAYLRLALASVVLNIALNLILIPRWAAAGTAIATVMTELAVAAIGIGVLTVRPRPLSATL